MMWYATRKLARDSRKATTFHFQPNCVGSTHSPEEDPKQDLEIIEPLWYSPRLKREIRCGLR